MKGYSNHMFWLADCAVPHFMLKAYSEAMKSISLFHPLHSTPTHTQQQQLCFL